MSNNSIESRNSSLLTFNISRRSIAPKTNFKENSIDNTAINKNTNTNYVVKNALKLSGKFSYTTETGENQKTKVPQTTPTSKPKKVSGLKLEEHPSVVYEASRFVYKKIMGGFSTSFLILTASLAAGGGPALFLGMIHFCIAALARFPSRYDDVQDSNRLFTYLTAKKDLIESTASEKQEERLKVLDASLKLFSGKHPKWQIRFLENLNNNQLYGDKSLCSAFIFHAINSIGDESKLSNDPSLKMFWDILWRRDSESFLNLLSFEQKSLLVKKFYGDGSEIHEEKALGRTRDSVLNKICSSPTEQEQREGLQRLYGNLRSRKELQL